MPVALQSAITGSSQKACKPDRGIETHLPRVSALYYWLSEGL